VEEHLENLKGQLETRYERLEESKRLGMFVHATRRLFEIQGPDLAGLLALELFTTIIPLILLGYSWASHFSTDLSFGDQLIRWMDLKGQAADIVRNLFGANANLRQTWTFLGIAGYLVWGIPMSSQVAKTYARAYRRERWPFWTEVWRGTLWFVVFLGTQAVTLAIARHQSMIILRILMNLALVIPSFILWSLSPVILVRHGGAGRKYLAWSGLTGVVLDLLLVRITLRWVFPRLLNGWVGFGPIGAAMAMMTTCTVIATLWVANACIGAVLWERTAPPDLVITTQTGNTLRAQTVVDG
jgi:uncharacterized BrkB/YihY/UPF0761 family membrane protein